MSDSWQQQYFDRVAPVVGALLRQRRVAVWDLGLGYLAAEALARTGLRQQHWFDDGQPSGAFAASFGASLAGQPTAGALSQLCRRHNTFEQDWRLTSHPKDLDVLRQLLATDPPDLLLSSVDVDVCRAAIDAGVPLLMTFVPATAAVGCLQLVWHPEAAIADNRQGLLDLCGWLATQPALDLDEPANHLDGLEARSLALGLARWILAPERPRRQDLWQPIIAQGQDVLLRGEPGWPWSVRWANANDRLLRELLATRARRYQPPAAFSRRHRVLVLGLGTASLFCGELPQLVGGDLFFVDCKAVSPFNPVRQLYGTEQIGQHKGDAMCALLARRLDPSASWQRTDQGALRYWRGGSRTLGWSDLRLRAADRASVERFSRILDEVQPTLAIVAMGRSRDDNFVATAELRRRGIRHLTPTAFPGVSHFKHIVTDGSNGPCYDCLQGHLAVDGGAGPTLQPDEREMFYGGTQPATLAETYPSAFSLLRLARDLGLPPAARPGYLQAQLAAERCCFVGSNRVERSGASWLYGVPLPFSMVTYGIEDLVGSRLEEHCPCGRINQVRIVDE